MGLLGQLGLLSRKNLKLRKRSPALTLTQLLSPVLVFVVIALLRYNFQPETKPNCYYDPKAMPSRGLVPFIQSITCGLSTSCKSAERGTFTGNELPNYHSEPRIAQISQSLSPLSNNATIESLKKLPDVLKPIAALTESLNSELLTNFTEKKYPIGKLFSNVSDVRRYLVEKGGLDTDVVEALLSSELRVFELLELSGFIDFESIVCNATRLKKYLTFPPTVDVEIVSAALCNVSHENVPIIITKLQQQLDIPYIINEFSQFLKALGQTDWSGLIDNASRLVYQLQDISNLGGFMEGLPSLLNIVKLVPAIQELSNQLQGGTLEKQLDTVASVMESVDVQLRNKTWWTDLKYIVVKAQSLLQFGTEYLQQFDYDDGVLLKRLFRNEPTIRHLLKQQFNLSQVEIQLIMSLRLKPKKIVELVELVLNTDRAADIFCLPGRQNIYEFVTLPLQDTSPNAEQILCKLDKNGNRVLRLLFNNTDILLLSGQIKQVIHDTSSSVNWNTLVNDVSSIVTRIDLLPEFIQRIPQILVSFPRFLGSFKRPIFPGFDWHGFLTGKDGFQTALNSSDFYLTLLEKYLPKSEFWLAIQEQLIIQNLAMELQISFLKPFTGGTCKDGWHANGESCYRYGDGVGDWRSAIDKCKALGPKSRIVSVNDEKEQRFLESIGQNKDSWLGIYTVYDGYLFWSGDWRAGNYTNWAPEQSDFHCAKANFGTDGLWHRVNCRDPIESYICESIEDHILTKWLTEQPFVNVTRILLEVGPNVTESIIKTFFNATKLQMFLRMTPEEQQTIFCREDFVILRPSDVAARQKLCQIRPWDILHSTLAPWNIPEIEANLAKLQIFSTSPNRTAVLQEYSEYASISGFFGRNQLLSTLTLEVRMRPFDPSALWDSSDFPVTGNEQDWLGMLSRVAASWNQELPFVEWMKIMTGTENTMLNGALSHFNAAFMQIVNTVVKATNNVFAIIKEFSNGQVFSGAQPETERFLRGVMRLLKETPDLLYAVTATWSNPRTFPDVSTPSDIKAIFCNDAIRRSSLLNGQSVNTSALDEYLCQVNFDLLAEELRTLISFDDIVAQINSLQTIPDNTTAPSMVSMADITHEVQTLNRNIATFSHTLISLNDHYNLTASLNTVLFHLSINLLTAYSRLTIPNELAMLDTAFQNQTWYRYTIVHLKSIVYFTEYFADRILVLKGKHLVFPEIRNLLANITETERLFAVAASFTPELTDAILSLVVKPEKLEEFLSFADPLTVICEAGNFSAYFTSPIDTGVDLVALEGAVCTIDLTQVELELKTVFQIDSFMSEFEEFLSFANPLSVICNAGNFSVAFTSPFVTQLDLVALEGAICTIDLTQVDPELKTVVPIESLSEYLNYFNTSSSESLSTIAQRFITLYERTEAFWKDPFSVSINETWLTGTFNEVVGILQLWNANELQAFTMDSQTSLLPLLQRLEAEFSSQSWWVAMEGPLKELISIVEYANVKLQPLPGRNITLFDLIPPSSADLLQRALEDFPEILAALTRSYVNVTKLERLSSPADVIYLICNNATGMTDLIHFLPGVNTTAINSVLCSFDYILLTEEWSQELKFQERVRFPLNVTATYDSVLSFIHTLNQLVQSPPTLTPYNDAWFQEKSRQTGELLEAFFPTTGILTGSELDNLLLLLDNALSGRGEYYDSFIMQFRLEDYINRFLIDQLQMFAERNWTLPTLEGLFADAANVRRILGLLDLSPDIVDMFLSLSLKPEKLSVFWLSPNPLATVCSTNQLSSFFDLPTASSQSNLTAVQEAICAIDFIQVPLEFTQHYNFSKIQRDLLRIYASDPSLEPFNFTSWAASRNQLSELVTRLVVSPPTLAVDPTWGNATSARLQDVVVNWFTKLQQMATENQVNSTIEILGQLEATLQSTGVWSVVRPYLEIFSLGLEGTVAQMRRQGDLLQNVFNTSASVESLVSVFSLSPDQIKAGLTVGAFPVFWLSEFQNKGIWENVFCNSTIFEFRFPLPPAVNSTAVQQAMCEVNRTELFDDFNQLHNVDILKVVPQITAILGLPGAPTTDFDWSSLVKYVAEITSLWNEINSAPFIHTGDWVSDMTTLLESLSAALLQHNTAVVVQVLEDIRPYFQDDKLLIQIRDTVQSIANLTNMLSRFNPRDALEELETDLRRLDIWHHVKPFLDFADTLIDGLNTNLHPGGELIPAFLYNRTILERFLSEVQQTASPDLALAVLTDQFFPIFLLAYYQLSDKWEETFCSEQVFGWLPSNINRTALREELCHLDRMKFFGMLNNVTGVDVLRFEQAIFEIENILPKQSNNTDPRFDWDDTISKVESIITALEGIVGNPALGNHSNMTEAMLLLDDLLNGLTQFNLKLAIEVLEKLDTLLNHGGVWSEIKRYLTTATDIAELINQQLDLFAASNYTIEGALRESAPEFLGHLLAPEHVQALLNATINPALYGALGNPEQVRSILCDASQFSSYVHLPEGTDVGTIQSALCSLAMTNETAVEELLSMFNIGQIYAEIQNLYNYDRSLSDKPTNVDWHQSLQSFQQLVTNLMMLPAGNDFISDFFRQFTAVSLPMQNLPPAFASLTSDFTSLCQALPPELLNSGIWNTFFNPVLSSVNNLMQITEDLVFTLPNHQYEFQSLLNNMTAIVEFLSVYTEVEQSLWQAGVTVLLDHNKRSLAGDLTLHLLQGKLPKGLVCNEQSLRHNSGIPQNVDVSDVSTLLCGFERILHTHAVQEVLRIVGFDAVVPKITALFNTSSDNIESFDCPAFVTRTQHFIERLVTIPSDFDMFASSFQLPQYLDLLNLLPQIATKVSSSDRRSLTELYHLLEPFIIPLLGNSYHNTTTISSLILSYVEMIDAYLTSPLGNTEFVQLTSLWSNTSAIRLYLSALEGWGPDLINTVINSRINISTLSELHSDIRNQLCGDDHYITRLLNFNDSTAASRIEQLVCGAVNITDVFSYFEQSLNITQLIKLITTPSKGLTLPEYLDQILDSLKDFAAIDPALLDGFITNQWPLLVDGTIDLPDLIQLAMSWSDLIRVAQSLRPLIDVLEPALKEDPTFRMIKELMESIIGFDGFLNLIEKLPDLSLSKLFMNPVDFADFLVENIGFSQQAANDLLSASLSFEVAATSNFSTVNSIVCNEAKFTQILQFPQGTNVTGIQQSLCKLNPQQLALVLDGVLKRLDIGSLVQELLTYSLQDTFGNSTSLSADLSQAATSLQPLHESLQTVIKDIHSLNLTSFTSGLEDFTTSFASGNSASQTSTVDSLAEMMCGEGSTFSLVPADAIGTNSGRRTKRSIGHSRARREDKLDKVPGGTPFCSSLYDAIQESENGRIIWHFIKPIILGKIPYAPDNEATAKIIKKSNFIFDDIATVRDVAKAWLAGSEDLMNIVDSQQLNLIEKFLQNSYTKEVLQDQLNLDTDMIASLVSNGLSDISSDDVRQFDTIARLIINVTECVALDRFVPCTSEKDLETQAEKLSRNNTLFAGVYFTNLQNVDKLPSYVMYKIRMDIDNTARTDQLNDKHWIAGANNRLIDQVYARGFIFVQDIIERGIIEAQIDNGVDKPGVYIQPMPYPCHIEDQFVERIANVLPVLMTLVFMAALATMTHQLVYEKELGIEELMKSMGLRSGLNLLSWFLNNLILMIIISAIIVIILKFGAILPSSDWSVILVFLLCFSFSIIMMCYMISSVFQRAHIAAVAAILIYLLSYVPYIPDLILDLQLNAFYQRALFSLSSSCAFLFGCDLLALKEAQTVGVHWNEVIDGFNQYEEFGFGWLCVAMLFDGILYFLIGWYISYVFPGRHGVPKPWFFVFLPKFWCGCFSSKSYSTNQSISAKNKNRDEMDHLSHPLGISITGLTKKYNKKSKAVDNLTLDFYQDQVTSFLGRNGAGKTTTISIIMGLFPATSGKVLIYGEDVKHRLRKIRKELGVCPQHNALYDQLTVQEHLEMYGRLKGMALKDIFQQSQQLMEDVGLHDSANEKVCNLSGGMKRKLSVMIAFLGGSKVVILDEPTSGVDPHARRAIWDLISKNKKGRTILLCTHFMDEADLLGDRIAILDQGQLRCCGSSTFLKNLYANGYTLTIAKDLPSNQATPENKRRSGSGDGVSDRKKTVENFYVETSDLKKMVPPEDVASTSSRDSSSGVSSIEERFNTRQMTSLIQSHVPSAVLKDDIGTEVSYTLPVGSDHVAKFQGLFNELDSRLPELHATSYGISDATLEEVFLKVSSPADEDNGGPKDNTKMVSEETLKNAKKVYDMKPTTLRQFLALLTKRFHYTKRDWWGLLWGLIVPIFWLLLAVLCSTLGTTNDDSYPALHFAPSLYGPDDYVFFSNSDSDTVAGAQLTNAVFSKPGFGTTCIDDFNDGSCEFVEPFFDRPLSNLTDTEIQRILKTDQNAPPCSCSNSFLECPDGAAGVPPPKWIMNSGDILLDVSLKTDLNEYLLRTTADFRFKRYNGLSLYSVKNSDGDTQEIVKAWYNNKGYHAMPISLNMANNMILRAFLQDGQDPAKYGISAYSHPFHFTKETPSYNDLWEQTTLHFSICLVIVVAFSMIPTTFAMFLVAEYNSGSKRLHYISGVTPFGYWLANLIWDMLQYLVPVGISLIIVYAFGMQAFASATNMPAFCVLLFLYGFAVACQMYLFVPLFKKTGTAFIVFFCVSFLIAILTLIPKFLQKSPFGAEFGSHNAFDYLDKILLIFSPFCLTSGLLNLLYNQVEADIYRRFGQDTYRDPFSYDMLAWNMIALSIEGAVAFVLLLVIEYTCRFRCADCKSGTDEYIGSEDKDVTNEKNRVTLGDADEDLVCIKNLTKVYRSIRNSSLVAVDNLCIGIPQGQCFGLLGVNGAGKTTTFRMITNDLSPTSGSIKIDAKSIGYCPQDDALYNQLTGTELLYCYARIKGIKGKECQMAVKSVTSQMGMQKYVGNRIGTYSGGMKRSLSTAIALLGNPQVVLMDEPTSGMDPIAKQAVWSNIIAMIKDGRSVILTSHSMEECELLCTRLAIMVNGQFQCLGSPQHVKHCHGDGYTVILRTSEEASNLNGINNFVGDKFPEARLKEQHHNMLRYQLPMTTMRLADIFGILEEEKHRLGIQDYSVTQTTLDQVFVNFAKKQTDGLAGSPQRAHRYMNRAFSATDEKDIDFKLA